MKKQCLTAALCLALSLGTLTAFAVDYNNRGTGFSTNKVNTVHQFTLEKDGADIALTRNYINENLYIEVQQVNKNGGNSAMLHIQGISIKDFTTVELVQDKTVLTTFSLHNPQPAVVKPADLIDRWYDIDVKALQAAVTDPKKCKFVLHKTDGKTYTLKATPYIYRLLPALQPEKKGTADNISPENDYYGPMYSVCFPGKSIKEVTDAFLYYLNIRDDKGKAESFDGYYRYSRDDTYHTAGFIYDYYGDQNQGFARFSETAQGTWIDLDFWTSSPWYTTDYYTKAHIYMGTNYSTGANDEFNNRAFEAVQDAYFALLPHTDYGITLKGGLNRPNPEVEKIDTTDFPNLSAIAPGDKLVAINGYDVSTAHNYKPQYIFDYAKPGTVLTLTLRNKKGEAYTIAATPRTLAPTTPAIDYAKALAQETGMVSKYAPYTFQPAAQPYFEYIAPYDMKDNHIEAPQTKKLREISLQ
jgi:hypothetical protein